MKKLGLQFFDIEKLLNLEEDDIKEVDGKPYLVKRKDLIKFDRNNKPKRTWILEGVSRDWKIDISLDAPDDEIDSLKESK
jgi:hypothetical protein|tara:strand:+ start:963 stop:1202 length:240 start_codon:yes stop_codon:yes gene_type:complete